MNSSNNGFKTFCLKAFIAGRKQDNKGKNCHQLTFDWKIDWHKNEIYMIRHDGEHNILSLQLCTVVVAG
jgi:hypothetical protein